MAKVTAKLQVTIPKAVADTFGIRPGDDIQFEPAGEIIHVIPHAAPRDLPLSCKERLALFDQATRRQKQRQSTLARAKAPPDRGWRREELYARGRAR